MLVDYLSKFTILLNSSAFRLAPPTNPPSISDVVNNSLAFEDFTLPPYCIITLFATSFPYISEILFLISLILLFASSEVAVFPVPIAQIGS